MASSLVELAIILTTHSGEGVPRLLGEKVQRLQEPDHQSPSVPLASANYNPVENAIVEDSFGYKQNSFDDSVRPFWFEQHQSAQDYKDINDFNHGMTISERPHLLKDDSHRFGDEYPHYNVTLLNKWKKKN